MTDERKRNLVPWRSADGTTVISRRSQLQAKIADAVFSEKWEALRAIKNELAAEYRAPVPTKDEQRQAFETYNIVREILDEFFRRAEADAALAPITGEEE